MARTTEEIESSIVTEIQSTDELSELTSTSKVSIWRLFVHIVAVAIRELEQLFDSHRVDINNALLLERPHTLRWYQTKVLSFQYGYDLIEDSDQYDNTALTPDEIAESKIIKYCAVSEAASESRLIIKIATGTDELGPLTDEQHDAFEAYINEIKDAGVFITIINNEPDRLFLHLRILYDPLVLNAEGTSILNGGQPVEDALNLFVKTLPFNGELSLQSLVDTLQKVEGVKIAQLDAALSSALDPELDDYGTPVAIDIRKVPDSGYFVIPNFDSVTYIPYV